MLMRLQARLAASTTSSTINTSFVERDNLTWRQHNRRLTRKTNGFTKELPWMEKQLWLTLAYYHLCLPHDSLRQRLPRPQANARERLAAQVAPGHTSDGGRDDRSYLEHERTVGYRVPATFLDTVDTIEHVFPPLDLIHHVS